MVSPTYLPATRLCQLVPCPTGEDALEYQLPDQSFSAVGKVLALQTANLGSIPSTTRVRKGKRIPHGVGLEEHTNSCKTKFPV